MVANNYNGDYTYVKGDIMKTTLPTTERTVTLMDNNQRVNINIYNIALESGVLPKGIKSNLKVIGANFTKELTRFEQIIRDTEVSEEFSNLRLLAQLDDGRVVTVRVQTLGEKGLFSMLLKGKDIELPKTLFKGKQVTDYRSVFSDTELMDTLTTRLKLLEKSLDGLELVVSKEFARLEFSGVKGYTKLYKPEVI